MAKLLIIYASMSGNTEEMAEEIAAGVRTNECDVDILEAFEASASILQNYEGILIGTYTWGDGEIPDELLDFYDELEDLDLSGKKASVFGSFDWSYGDGGIAVDMVQTALSEQGAAIIQEPLKVEFDPTPDERMTCQRYGRHMAAAVETSQSA